jgi:hypothetical protein
MIQSEHFAKDQCQMLIAVTWFHNSDSSPQKPAIEEKYYVFCSAYLAHSSLFFQKSYDIFKQHVNRYLQFTIKEEILLSDGSGQQFKNKNDFYWASQQSKSSGLYCLFLVFDLLFTIQDTFFWWWYDPSYHGKGKCDAKSASIKRAAAKFLEQGAMSIT